MKRRELRAALVGLSTGLALCLSASLLLSAINVEPKIPANPIAHETIQIAKTLPKRYAPAPTKAPPVIEPEIYTPAPTYTQEELETLALIIYQEAGADYCSNEIRQMVGEVVLNRVASPLYPDTLHEVATQPSQYGLLHWTGLVWPERAQYDCEAHAVARAYECAEALLSETVERLLPEDVIYQAEFPQGSETVEYFDGFYFCR